MELYSDPGDQYELLPAERVTLNGNQVITRKYTTAIQTPLPLVRKDAYIVRQSDGFIITLTATQEGFPNAEAIFDHMVSTFQ